MSLSAYIVWFAVASMVGWVAESIYSILYSGKWERRGFLFGPFCPIYGVGTVSALVLFARPELPTSELPAWAIFIICMVGSAILEYGVSVVLERMFGALWWDYSNLPLNLNGRVCLPASLVFGIAGVIISRVLAPGLTAIANQAPPLLLEVIALITVALLACDLTASAISLSDLMAKIVSIDESANRFASVQVEHAVDAVHSVSSMLTERQMEMLAHLRRFSSEDLRAKADALRQALMRHHADEDDEHA